MPHPSCSILITQNWLLTELCENIGLPLPLSYLCCKPSLSTHKSEKQISFFLAKASTSTFILGYPFFDRCLSSFTSPFPIFLRYVVSIPAEIAVAIPYKHVSHQLAHCVFPSSNIVVEYYVLTPRILFLHLPLEICSIFLNTSSEGNCSQGTSGFL